VRRYLSSQEKHGVAAIARQSGKTLAGVLGHPYARYAATNLLPDLDEGLNDPNKGRLSDTRGDHPTGGAGNAP
jgi:hypothetical protein